MERQSIIPFMHKIGKYFSWNYIKWNPTSRRYEPDYSSRTKRGIVVLNLLNLLTTSLCLHSLIGRNTWNKTEIIFAIEVPIFAICAILIIRFPYASQQRMLNVLESLNEIDTLLTKCGVVNIKKRKVSRKVLVISYMFLGVLLEMIFAWTVFVIRPELREVLLQGGMGPMVFYHTFCTTCLKLILIDRIDLLNSIIQITAVEIVSSANCFLCKKSMFLTRKTLCSKHMSV